MQPVSKPLSLSVGGVLAMVFGGLAVLGSLCMTAGGLLSGLTLSLQETADHHHIVLRKVADEIAVLETDIAAGNAQPDAGAKLEELRLRETDVQDHFKRTNEARRRMTTRGTWLALLSGLPAMILGAFLFFSGLKAFGGSDLHRRRAIGVCLGMCLLLVFYGLAQLLFVIPEATRMNELIFDPEYMPQQMMMIDMKAAQKFGNIFFGVIMFGVLSMFGLAIGMLAQRSAAEWCQQKSKTSSYL